MKGWTPRLGRLLLLGALLAAGIAVFVGTSSARERLLAGNTLFLVAWTCGLSLPLGTMLALLVVRTDLPGRRVLGVLLATMLFMPLYLQTAAWQAGFGQQGWFTLAYSQLAAEPLLFGWRGAIWIHTLAAVPWVALIVGAGLYGEDSQLEDAALIDASTAAVLLRVTLRGVLTSLVVSVLWVMVLTAGEITVTDMWQLRTYAEEVFIGFALGETPQDVQLGMLPGAMLVVALVIAATVLFQSVTLRGQFAPTQPPRLFRLGSWRWPLALVSWAFVALIIGIPLINLVAKVGIDVQQWGELRVRTWSLAKAIAVAAGSGWMFRREIGWSLLTGGAAAVASAAIAIPLAWRTRYGMGAALAAFFLAAVCLAVPGPIIGLLLIEVFNQPGLKFMQYLYDHTIAAPAVALTLRALPLAILVLWHALRSIPEETLESAATDGASPLWRVLAVGLSQRRAAIAATLLVALAVAMGDLSASYLVLPPGVSPLSQRIFQMIHADVNNDLAGVCLWITAVFALLGLAAMHLLKRQGVSPT